MELTQADVLALVRAGYTKEEISAMNSEPTAEEPKQEPEKVVPDQTEPVKKNSDSLEEKDPGNDFITQTMQEVMNKVTGLEKTIQNQNRQDARIPQEDKKPQTAPDILASVFGEVKE